MNKYMTKKELVGCLIILIICFAIYAGYAIYNDLQVEREVTDYELLSPVQAEVDFNGWENDDNVISLSDKQKIAYHKYGFRKKINITKPTVITLYAGGLFSLEHMYYGIYKDELLTAVVNEVDLGYNWKASGAIEEGAELEDYPKYQEMIIEPLEPGTYYIGVFTTKAGDDFDFTYRSQYCTQQEEYQLKENEEQYFFICKSVQETYFRIDAEDNQKVEITSTCEIENLQLCDKDFSPIKILDKRETGNGNLYTVQFPKEGIYYLKHTGELDLNPPNRALNSCRISYRTILQGELK